MPVKSNGDVTYPPAEPMTADQIITFTLLRMYQFDHNCAGARWGA